jgi:Xaa-Pro aminopeptidase
MIELRAAADGLLREDGPILIDDALWAAFVLPLQEVFSARRFGLASTILAALRLSKGPSEAAAMRKAGDIADQALEVALGEPILGVTELQLAARLESAMLGLGAEGVAFETLVASGPNSALPHYRAGKRTVGLGDVVILDFGCRWDGYCSDITRTVTCGSPGEGVTSAYEAVAQAHDAAFRKVASGTPAEDVDRAARETLTAAGYGPAFTHRTGHGIGLDVHEPPYIVAGNRTELSKGMTFSIEPGAYFPGRFGVRLEDVAIVGERGGESMTHSPRDLRIVR